MGIGHHWCVMRAPVGEHFVEDTTKGVEIACVGVRTIFPDFGRHIMWCANLCVCQIGFELLCDAQVSKFDDFIIAHEDIHRLQISMNDAVLMQDLQSA